MAIQISDLVALLVEHPLDYWVEIRGDSTSGVLLIHSAKPERESGGLKMLSAKPHPSKKKPNWWVGADVDTPMSGGMETEHEAEAEG